MKGGRYPMLIVLLGAWVGNGSQAAPQHVHIDATKSTVVSSAAATLGGPAPGSGNKTSGTRFPLIPAGALAGPVSATRPHQPYPLPTKTGLAVSQASYSAQLHQATATAGPNNRTFPAGSGAPAARSGAVAYPQTESSKNTRGNALAILRPAVPKLGPQISHGTAPSKASGRNAGSAQSIQEDRSRQNNPRPKPAKLAAGAQVSAPVTQGEANAGAP